MHNYFNNGKLGLMYNTCFARGLFRVHKDAVEIHRCYIAILMSGMACYNKVTIVTF